MLPDSLQQSPMRNTQILAWTTDAGKPTNSGEDRILATESPRRSLVANHQEIIRTTAALVTPRSIIKLPVEALMVLPLRRLLVDALHLARTDLADHRLLEALVANRNKHQPLS